VYYYRRNVPGPFVWGIVALIGAVMLIHAIIAAAITLGVIVGIAGALRYGIPVAIAMLRGSARPLRDVGSALMSIRR
jgi:hypothetical protein